MIGAIATCTAKPGRMEALVAAALDHESALRRQPGYVASYVLSEPGGSTQVSFSVFETADQLRRALEATRSVIERHRLDELVDGPPSFRTFDLRVDARNKANEPGP